MTTVHSTKGTDPMRTRQSKGVRGRQNNTSVVGRVTSNRNPGSQIRQMGMVLLMVYFLLRACSCTYS